MSLNLEIVPTVILVVELMLLAIIALGYVVFKVAMWTDRIERDPESRGVKAEILGGLNDKYRAVRRFLGISKGAAADTDDQSDSR